MRSSTVSLFAMSLACVPAGLATAPIEPSSRAVAAPDPAPEPAIVTEAEPEPTAALADSKAGWRAAAIPIENNGRELHLGFELAGQKIELVARAGLETVLRIPVSTLPTCEAYEPGGTVERSFLLEGNPRVIEWTSECTPRAPDGSAYTSTLDDGSCTLTVEPGLPTRLLVMCESYYEGGAHPDIGRSWQRFFTADFSAVPSCELDEVLAQHPERVRRLEQALNAAGCPAKKYAQHLSCQAFLARDDGGGTLIISIYPPRVERMTECDQLEVIVHLPSP